MPQAESDCDHSAGQGKCYQTKEQSREYVRSVRTETDHGLHRYDAVLHGVEAAGPDATPRAVMRFGHVNVAMFSRASPQGLTAASVDERAEVNDKGPRDGGRH